MFETLPFYQTIEEGTEIVIDCVSPEQFAAAVNDIISVIVFCAFAIIGTLVALKIAGGRYR